MTYMPTATQGFAPYSTAADAVKVSKPAPAVPEVTIWRRIFNSVWASRQAQADREIARYLALNGGTITDSTEREIARRLTR